MGSPMRLACPESSGIYRVADGTWRQDELGGGSDDDFEDGRCMTVEECRKYTQQVEESEGFDVDALPEEVFGFSLITPLTEDELKGNMRDIVNIQSRIALDDYNIKQGTNWKVKQVIKANTQVVGGLNFYITFIACDHHRNLLQTFQARLYNADVKFCRPVELSNLSSIG